MLHSASPFYPYTFPQKKSRPAPTTKRTPPAVLEVKDHGTAYIVLLSCPAAFELVRPSVQREGQSSLLFKATIHPLDESHEYIITRRAPIFAEPRRTHHHCVGILPVGSLVHGTAPLHGWIEMEGEEGWLLEDESVVLRSRPAPIRSWSQCISVPYDANLDDATSRVFSDSPNQLVVTLPKMKQRLPSLHQLPPAPPQPRSSSPPSLSSRPAHPQPFCPPKAASGDSSKFSASPSYIEKSALDEKSKTAVNERSSLHSSSSKKRPQELLSQPSSERRAMQPTMKRDDAVTGRLPICDAVLSGPLKRSASNVNHPEEHCDNWIAAAGGGFFPESMC